MYGCPKCGGTFDDDGNCRFSDCVNDSKDARIAALEAALAKAEEALEESGDIYGSHFIGDGCSCVKCRGLRRKAALAAIREVKNG